MLASLDLASTFLLCTLLLLVGLAVSLALRPSFGDARLLGKGV